MYPSDVRHVLMWFQIYVKVPMPRPFSARDKVSNVEFLIWVPSQRRHIEAYSRLAAPMGIQIAHHYDGVAQVRL